MEGYLVYCVFVCLFFVCTVTDFSAAEKARGVKFCVHVGLLSGQVFSPFGEDWLAGSHGGGISSGMNIGIGCLVRKGCGEFDIPSAGTCGEARWAVRIGGRHMVGFPSCWQTCYLNC